MLTLHSGNPQPYCDRVSRRGVLRVGSLGLGGLGLAELSLPDLLPRRARVLTAFPKADKRPSFGSIVSRLYEGGDARLPKFVSLSSEYNEELRFFEQPQYVGAAHRAFIPTRAGLENFRLLPEITLDRL